MASGSEEDLEDGELPSSEDESQEIKQDEIDNPDTVEPGVDTIRTGGESSLKRPFESTEGDNDEEKDNRDTPTSPPTKRPKRDKEGARSGGSDGEEGEIFSDDEEAAYYPQLVKPKNDRNTSSPFSQDTYGHYGDRENHTSYRSREGGRYRHQNRRWTQHENERRERGNNRASDLVGTPIRHDRYHGDKKWSDYSPSLTLETIESRISRNLALLPTPKTNQISLDEMNYPAPPQWYLKSVSAFHKNKAYQKKFEDTISSSNSASNTEEEPVGYTVNDELEVSPVKLVNPVSSDTPPPISHQPIQQTLSETSPSSSSSTDTLNSTQLVSTATTPVSMETRVSPIVNTSLSMSPQEVGPDHQLKTSERGGGGGGNLATSQDIVPGPPAALSLVEAEKESREDENSQLLQLTVRREAPIVASITKGKRRGGRKSSSPAVRKRNLRTSTNKTSSPLLVSIKLSRLQMDSGRLVDSEDTGFNYDDYLDQLNNEEEEEEVGEDENNGGFDFKAAAADFWIDTSPSKGGGTGTKSDTTSSPLDEEFPLLQGDKRPRLNSRGPESTGSLTAIVGEQTVDEGVHVLELEGKKDDSQMLKKNISKMKIPRKRKEKHNGKVGGENPNESPENVHVPADQQEPQPPTNPAAKIPCKYFLNGHCIHKDNCMYSHAVKREKKREMCKFFLQDACDKGDDCLFYHGGFPCRYFHTRHMCYHGDKCKFSHAPLTQETYDILMSVIEPNMRDFVRYPPPPPPMAPPTATPIPFEGPESRAPNPLDLPPGPYGPSYHNPPPVDGHWSTDVTHERNVHVHVPQPVDEGQHWAQKLDEEEKLKTNVRLSPGFNVSELFPEPHPQVLPHELATQLRKVLLPTPLTTEKENEEEKKKENEEFELEYWENKDRDASDSNTGQEQPSPNSLPPSSLPPPPPFHSPPSSHVQSAPQPQHVFTDHTRPLLDQPAPPALMPVGPRPGFMPPPPGLVLIRHSVPPPRSFHPHHPIIIRGPPNLAPPFYPGPHPPVDQTPPLLGPSPQHRFAPPPHVVGSGIISETAPDPRSASDPRFSRSAKSPPRPQPLHQSPPTSRPDATNPGPPPLAPSSRSSENFSSSASQSLPETRARGGVSAPPTSASSVWGSSGATSDKTESVRLVNPREKYSHLKIKPKTSGGGMSPDSSALSSVLKKQHEGPAEDKRKDERHLPSLLQKTAVLDKPLPPHELFGTPPKDAENISLFGSRQQVPDSPIPNETQAFGEIKMSTLSIPKELQESMEGDIKEGGDSEEGHAPSVPSYLTHLGLGDENDVQIESAFSSLQAKQRRLSEMSASIVSEDTLSSQPEPHPSSDVTTPTTDASNISKMFSFGSSLY